MNEPERKEEKTPAPTSTALAPIPPSVEEEDKLATFYAEQNLARMAIVEPEKVEKAMQALARVMRSMREIAIQDTVGIDWTLYKDRDGREVGVPRDSGCVKMRKWLGVSVYNHRHDDGSGKEGPRVWTDAVDEGDGTKRQVQVVSGLVDAHCVRTGETIVGIPYAVRNEPDQFTGRKHPKTKLSNISDMLASWRTGADAKATRVLGGVRKIPKEELQERGVDVTKCYLGHGHGSSADRAAAGVSETGIEGRRTLLRNSILRRVGGELDAAKKLLRECTSRPPNPRKKGDKGFAGCDSVERLTMGWQIDNAFTKLKAHPVFGNKALQWPDEAEIVEEKKDPDEMGDPSKPQAEDREPGEDG